MNNSTQKLSIRWLYLVIGTAAMLFAGIIYAWSILRSPLEAEFGWAANNMALNFTLTMCFFCIGAFLAGILSKRLGVAVSVIVAGLIAAAGLVLTSTLSGSSVVLLYLFYGIMAGTGIGFAYNVILSTVSAWFPDKKGLCSGVLLMGFGASALVLGNLAGSFIRNADIGWRFAFRFLGISLGVVMIVAGLVLRKPPEGTWFPQPKAGKATGGESFEPRDFTTVEMIRRPSFWMAFVCIVFLAAVGNSVISFASQLSQSVGATLELATVLVGVLSVCNGLGRILTGAFFDSLGRRMTMLAANILTIAAAGITLVAVLVHSLPLCIVGLCLTGLSYGSCPTVTSAFTSAFYGTKYFPTNFSIMNFNLMGASFMATASSALLTSSGGYIAPFILLLCLSVAALVLNLLIRKP